MMLAFIFLILGLGLVMLTKRTTRQAEIGRDDFIAYQLAEAGVADALFRLNYSPESGSFPFAGTFPTNSLATSELDPTDPTPGEILRTADENIDFDTPAIRGEKETYRPFNGTTGDYYRVSVIKVDSAAPDPPPTQYKIVSEGFYKGAHKKIEVKLRGKQSQSSFRHGSGSTNGISEAFNKHIIYANKVDYFDTWPGTPSTAVVYGNIVYANIDTAGKDTDNWNVPNYITNPYSKTKVEGTNFKDNLPIPSPPTLPSSSMPTSTPVWTYDPSGGPYPASVSGGGSSPTATEDPAGTFTFDTGNNISSATLVNGNVILQGTCQINAFLETATGKDITVNATTVVINGTLKSGQTIDMDPFVPSGDINGVVAAANSITIANLGSTTATDTIISQNGNITLNGGKFTGPIISGGDITLNSGTYEIDNSSPTNTNSDAPIYGRGTITISSGVTFTSGKFKLGANQKTAILAYSDTVPVTINLLNADLIPTYRTNNPNGAQAAIIAYSAATATVSINSNINDVTTPGRGRLIYAYGDTNTTEGITLDASGKTVYGCLVTNGTVTLKQGTLRDDLSTSLFSSVPKDVDIYQGFLGGRRAYIPVIGGWK
ncbi:MAG: hypothetical protein V2A65_08150 [Candidatus Omnitrophota bacterium]